MVRGKEAAQWHGGVGDREGGLEATVHDGEGEVLVKEPAVAEGLEGEL